MDPVPMPTGQGPDTVTDGPTRFAVKDAITLDDSSGTDVSMSATSDDEDEGVVRQADPAPSGVNRVHASSLKDYESQAPVEESTRKRKGPGVTLEPVKLGKPAKKVKLDQDNPMKHGSKFHIPSDRSLLPAEIWHHVFTFVPPRTLGSVLQVNKPDAIWQSSRRRHWPKMPAPLLGKTELDMWRLLYSRRCQFCRCLSQRASVEALEPGPGVDGVKIIWPFSVTSCGPCLLTNSIKELNLLLSTSTPSLLLPALQFVLITEDMRVFSPEALEIGQVPQDLLLTKLFFSTHVATLQEEFFSVKNLGLGAAEEWVKGLEDRGRRDRLDAARWEKWEAAGALSYMRNKGSENQPDDPKLDTEDLTSSLHMPSSSATRPSLGRCHQHNASDSSLGTTTRPDPHLVVPLAVGHNELSWQSPQSSLQATSQPSQQPRTRTREEALEMKAARRAEIERRAMLLKPSLPPNVLAHIPSFQAALQITTPLDDGAWELLKPRLLAQRTDAEKREGQEQVLAGRSQVAKGHPEGLRASEGQTRETKELMDKDWDDAQAHLRAEISMYADHTLRDDWDDGNKVNKENAPRFAAAVLLYVRKRFYDEISRVAMAASAAGKEPIRDPPQGPFTQKLTLENMRWLFDTKIKPHTESYRKELFLCNGCEDNFKAYGFEGVVQHYAAKHTSSLSLGSVVVYWRSEWPEISPFHPDPLAKVSRSQAPMSASLNRAAGHAPYPHVQHPPLPLGEGLPSPVYGPPHFSHHVAPGHLAVLGSLGHPPGTHLASPAAYGPAYPQQTLSYNGGYGPHVNSLPQLPPAPHTTPFYYPPQLERPVPDPSVIQYYGPSHDSYQPSGQAVYSGHSPYPDKVRIQLEDLAYNSRDLWVATTGVKELPGNVRLYVVLHHLAKRYRARFSESPPLAMFIDGLSNNKEMRPVRNVNRLRCKTCNLGLGNPVQVQGERSVFSFPQLVNHFQQRHIEPLQAIGAPLLDWTTDMVYVPDLSSLSNLRAMTGTESHKYALIADAFPQVKLHFDPGSQVAMGRDRADDMAQTSCLDPVSMGGCAPTEGPSLPVTTAISHRLFEDNGPRNATDEIYQSGKDAQCPPGHISQAGRAPPTDVYTPPPPKNISQNSSRGDSGRESPDMRHGSTAKHHRRRKVVSKERRVGSGQGGKPRKAHDKKTVGVLPNAFAAEDDGYKEVEEETQRQEEAIRAMWAAERREAARLASVSVAPQLAESRDGVQQAEATLNTRLSDTARSGQVSPAAHRSPRRHPPSTSPTSAADEEDLFAGLESHLEEQRVLSSAGPRHPQPKTGAPEDGVKRAGVDRQPATVADNYTDCDEAPSPRAKAATNERSWPQMPPRDDISDVRTYPRHPSWEQNLVVRETASAYVRMAGAQERPGPIYAGRSGARRYSHDYGQETLQDPYKVYTGSSERLRSGPSSGHYGDPFADELLRHRPTPSSHGAIAEAYELVLVQDPHGEYYIRRPIRREPEALYSRYSGERATYRDATAHRGYRGGEGGGYQQPLVYEPVMRTEGAGGGATAYEDVRNHDKAAAYEEYDPRFPGAPSSLGPSRHVRQP